MTKLQNLWGQAKAADAGPGRHPLGQFPGTITGIEEKLWDGKPIYEMTVQTEVGTAKHAVFDLDENDLHEMGEDKFLKALAWRKRLVVDLGQPEPNSYEEWLTALGQTVGAPCTLVVQEHRTKKGEVVTFINAPHGEAAAGAGGAPKLGQASTGGITKAPGRAAAGPAAATAPRTGAPKQAGF